MGRPTRNGDLPPRRDRVYGGEAGWVMLALLFLLAVIGTSMAALGTVWTTAVQREKEAELLFIGAQFSRALESYHRASPGPEKSYPQTLEALVLDPRFPMPVRHLRRIYTDPMTGAPDWGLVRDAQGGIIGIHSQSESSPFKQTGFARGQEGFAEAASYRDWVFKAEVEPGSPTTSAGEGSQVVRTGGPSPGAPPATNETGSPPGFSPPAPPTR